MWPSLNKLEPIGHSAAAAATLRHDDPSTHVDVLMELQEKKAILAAAERLAQLRGWSYDVASRSLQWSSDANGIFAFSPEELRDLSVTRYLQRIHPEDKPALLRLVSEVLTGKRRTFEFTCRFLAPRGKLKLIAGDGEAFLGTDGAVQRVVGAVMEVQQYEPAQQPQLPDQRFDTLEHSASVWLWEQDQELRFTSFTRTRNEALNDAHTSAIGRRRWEAPGAVPCSGTWKDHKKVLEERRVFLDFEYRLDALGGEERVFSTTGVPAFAPDGQFIGYRGTASDVTDLKAAQESALRTRALLHLASRLGRVGAWTLELPSMDGLWSPELLKLYEFDPHQRVTAGLLVGLVPVDQRDAIGALMQACHMQGTPVDVEFPSLTAKGNTVWLHLTAEAVRDPSGSIVRMQGAVQDITERKREAQRLKSLNQKLTTTFESIADGFVTLDRDLRFTYVNRQAEQRIGLSRSDLLGKSLSARFPKFSDSEFRREFDRALAEGTPGHVEAFSGTFERWLRVDVFPSTEGLALYLRDVTKSKQAQKELVLSEERYRLLFEASADGIVKVLPDGRIRHSNRAACAMFGRTQTQMEQLSSRQLVSPADRRLESMVKERLQSGGARGELTLIRADGSTFEAEVNSSTFKNAQGETFINIVIRDATERIQFRQKLIALNDELTQQVRERTHELERANGELRGFARSLAHDLRQPIAAAKSLAFAVETALAREDTERARGYAGQVSATAQWMNDYVEGLLSLTRISQTELAIEDVDLSALARGLLEELQYQQPERRAVIDVQPELHARGDRTLLRVLLQNLLGNAWKFTGRKELSRIAFTAAKTAEGEVVYCVEDNGAGLDVSRAERLFETFQRFHKASDYPGTGIGLANAHKIVSKHGGRVWAESQPGHGAKFFFTLAAVGGKHDVTGA